MAQRLRAIGILRVVTLVALFALLPGAWAAVQNVAVKDNANITPWRGWLARWR